MTIKILAGFLVKIDENILKAIRNCKGHETGKIRKKGNKVEGCTLPDFISYYEATAIKRDNERGGGWEKRKERERHRQASVLTMV